MSRYIAAATTYESTADEFEPCVVMVIRVSDGEDRVELFGPFPRETAERIAVEMGPGILEFGRTEEAMRYFAEMLQLAWRYDNFAKAGAAYSRLARGYRRFGKYDLAMDHLRRAHELFTRSRDDRGIASTLDDMGRVNWLRGGFGQALEFHRQALTIRRAKRWPIWSQRGRC